MHALDRMGIRAELAHAGNWSGLVLLPIFAALLVPFFEAVAALFLIAVIVLDTERSQARPDPARAAANPGDRITSLCSGCGSRLGFIARFAQPSCTHTLEVMSCTSTSTLTPAP